MSVCTNFLKDALNFALSFLKIFTLGGKTLQVYMPAENVFFFFGINLCENVTLHSIYDYCKIALILYIGSIVCHVISCTVTKSYKIDHRVVPIFLCFADRASQYIYLSN